MNSKFSPEAGDPFSCYAKQREAQMVVFRYDRTAVLPGELSDLGPLDQSELLTEGEEIDLLGPL